MPGMKLMMKLLKGSNTTAETGSAKAKANPGIDRLTRRESVRASAC